MKRLIVIMAVLSMFAGCSSMEGMGNPEKMACERACNIAKDKCLQKADGDKAKGLACNYSRDKCVQKCNK